MYNYISLAQNNGIHISNKMYDTTIKNYTLTKENDYVKIVYMNEKTKYIPLEEASLEEIKQEQETAFRKIKRKVGIHSGIMNGFKITLLGADIFLSTANFLTGNTLGGFAFLLLGTSMSLNKTGSKIYSEMKVISWLLENQDKVNAMIKEDVESYMHVTEGDMTTMNPTMVYKYPYDEVLYPREMYEEGINLNNIESLTPKELKFIKKKTKQREKLLRNK